MSIKAPSNSNEELLIRALVDDIYQIEEKINSIYDQINKNKDQNPYLKKIEELKICRNNLIQQKINLNDTFLSDIKNNSNEIQQKSNLIKEIEDKITYMKNELINFDTLSFQTIKLKKYILSNKSEDFLSEKQINDIIFDSPSSQTNSDLLKLKREIEINKASENVVINNYNDINSKIAQIEENIKMLKEEKMTIKFELINLISCKESLESIIKLNINQLNIHNKFNNKKNKDRKKENKLSNNNNEWTKPSELFIYELMVIDSRKAANNICNQLFNVFNIIDNEENIYKEKLMCSIKHRNNKKNNDKKIITSKTTDEYCKTFDNFINQSNPISEYSNFNLNKNNNINNDSFHNYHNICFKYKYKKKNNNILYFDNDDSNLIFNKKIISTLIQNELDKFISGEINSYKTISEFLENLSMIIISKFQYANIIISADTLNIYLSYSFKSLYYETIINSKLKFINKDYKTIKKNYKKLIPYLYTESSKLKAKYHEFKSKTEIIEKQIKLIKNENINKVNTKNAEKINLSLDEQNYIKICTKANGLIKQKKNLQKIIKEYETKKNKLKNENNLMINKLNVEIKSIDNEIVKINKDMKIQNNKANKDIDYYNKMIKEKYNIIKKQLQAYKDKYGSNLDIYNRLINSINSTINRSHSKQPLIIINNNNNISNKNIFSYDLKNDINNNDNSKIKTNASNENTKELLLFQNDNTNNDTNNEFNEEIINNNINNINKEILSIGNDISTFDKSPYDQIKFKEIINSSVNHNISTNNQIRNNNSNISLKEKNIKKVNERRRAIKALSNVDCIYKSNNSYASSEFMNKTNQINIKKISINKNHIKVNKNKTFYNSSSQYENIHYKKKLISNNKIKNIKIRNVNNIKNINCTSERRYDKYNKFFSNYYRNNLGKLITNINNTNDSISIDNKLTYQSYSYINKSNKKRTSSHNITKDKNNKFHNSITQKKMGLSPNTDKINNNHSSINNNNYLINKDLHILPNFLQNLNNTINQKRKGSYQYQNKIIENSENNTKFYEKVKYLKKLTFCYYRKYNKKFHKYNPLFDISSEHLCKSPYNFNPATISLNQELNYIIINPIKEELGQIEIKIKDIENTIVSSKIKIIIEVHRNFRKYKETSKYKSIEDFINNQMSNHPSLTGDEIEKCAKNKNFNFSILLSGQRIIELILFSYEDLKKWINGLAFLIKNKSEIIQTVIDNNNYENN